MTFSLTSPRRSHLLRSRWLHPVSPGEQTAAPSFPLELIGDFLNLLNRPLFDHESHSPLTLYSPFLAWCFPVSHSLGRISPQKQSLSTAGAACGAPQRRACPPPDNRLAPCYLFFKLFAFHPSPPYLFYISYPSLKASKRQ